MLGCHHCKRVGIAGKADHCSFEGGCKYPYLSEVARGGWGWSVFLLGTFVGFLPWIIFAFDYYKVFKLLSLTIKSQAERKLYVFRQKVVLLFNILSAFGMLGVAFFDMGNWPMAHMYVGTRTSIQ